MANTPFNLDTGSPDLTLAPKIVKAYITFAKGHILNNEAVSPCTKILPPLRIHLRKEDGRDKEVTIPGRFLLGPPVSPGADGEYGSYTDGLTNNLTGCLPYNFA
jgi:hypothetical protein